ncbi:MAG TPA: PAS domain S-box protein, partial [Gemmataceae bacterium]|nr:PAS domain S-box protein [Gemmataceae bacterium]
MRKPRAVRGLTATAIVAGLLAPVLWACTRAGPTHLALLEVPLAGGFSLGDALLLTSLLVLLVCVLLFARRARDAEQADAQLGDLLHAIPDGVLTVSHHGIILSANTRAERLLGYSADELVGSPLQSVLPAWSLDPPTRPQFDVTSRPEEVTASRKDGTEVRVAVATGRRRPGRPITVVLRDVTRVRRTEEMLNARDAHLRLIVEQMPAILWTTDKQLRITSTAGGGLAALKLNPREVIGMTMHEALERHDLDTTPITAHLRSLRGESLGYEMEWQGRHFQVCVEPLRDKRKEIAGTIGLVLDITDRKQTMDELRDRLRQQQAVARLGQQSLEGLPSHQLLTQSAVLVAAALGVDVCEVLEFAPGEQQFRARICTGWEASGAPEPATPPESSQAAFTLQTGGPVTVEDLSAETRFRPSQRLLDGRIVSAATVLIAGKQQPFGVLSAYTTRRRVFGPDDLHFLQAVANLLANTLERRRAEEGQQRLIAILEATPDCVAIARTDRRLLYANGTARRLLGKGERDDVSGLSLDSLYRPDALPEFLAGNPRPAGNVWTGEGVLRDHTGREGPVSQVLLAHRTPAGAVEFFSLIARDLGERQRLEEQLRQAQKMEAVGRLAGGIAHDFNNLLCVITGHGDLLRQVLPREQDEWHEHAEAIQKATERATGLTRQLLAFARKQMPVLSPVDLNVLVSDMERMLRRLIGEDVELVSNLAPASILVQGDRGQLEQVVMNLAVNARDAMPRGGRLTITTAYSSGEPEGPAAVTRRPHTILSVSDTGCG